MCVCVCMKSCSNARNWSNTFVGEPFTIAARSRKVPKGKKQGERFCWFWLCLFALIRVALALLRGQKTASLAPLEVCVLCSDTFDQKQDPR
jgi:hypothetical protein